MSKEPEEPSALRVDPRSPHRVHVDRPTSELGVFPPGYEKTTAKIAILDNPEEKLIATTDEVRIFSSHMGEVLRRTDVHPSSLELYSRISPDQSVPTEQTIPEVLEHILKTHKETGVKVVNLSYGANVTLKQLNELLQNYGSIDGKARGEITAGNLRERYGDLREAAEKASEHNVRINGVDLRYIQREVALIEALYREGVVVVRSAGNEENGQAANLQNVLSPHTIVSGGLKIYDGTISEQSSFNSRVDDLRGGYAYLQSPDGSTEFIALGTSYAVPVTAVEAARFIDQGMLPTQVANYFRERTKQLVNGSTDRVLIPEMQIIAEMSGDFDNAKLPVQEMAQNIATQSDWTKAARDFGAILGTEWNLNSGELDVLMSGLNAAVQAKMLDRNDFVNCLHAYAQLSPRERQRAAEALMKASNRHLSAAEVLDLIRSRDGGS